MFDLKNYIMKLLIESMGKEPDYKIRENALKWYERGTLTTEDLQVIDTMLEERKKNFIDEPVEEETEEENIENSDKANQIL